MYVFVASWIDLEFFFSNFSEKIEWKQEMRYFVTACWKEYKFFKFNNFDIFQGPKIKYDSDWFQVSKWDSVYF